MSFVKLFARRRMAQQICRGFKVHDLITCESKVQVVVRPRELVSFVCPRELVSFVRPRELVSFVRPRVLESFVCLRE